MGRGFTRKKLSALNQVMPKENGLLKTGYALSTFPLSGEIRDCVRQEDWEKLDRHFQDLTRPEGELSAFLKSHYDFTSIEFIISVRDAMNPWEEDGIWHDDGSRVFAFSLSLTEDPSKVEGGNLGLRRIGSDEVALIPTPEFGGIILFLTGTHGFEHRIHRVTKGKRIIIAGWCS